MGKGMGGEEGEGTKFKKENKTKQKKRISINKRKINNRINQWKLN